MMFAIPHFGFSLMKLLIDSPKSNMMLTHYTGLKVMTRLLTLLWYHGVNMTPGLFDRLNIPNFKIISFHLALYFLCRFLSTVSIHSILILMLPFLYILHFICLRSY